MNPSWQAGFVETNGIQLHYTRTGGNKPPFILVHGFSDDGLCWSAVAEILSRDYDVVMPDARGHGRSSVPLQGYGPLDQARDLYGLIQSLGLSKPIVLGHSMGAITSLVLAGLYPECPGAVLLEDPPAFWNLESRREPQNENPNRGLKAWALRIRTRTQAELLIQVRAENPGWSEAEVEPWVDSKLRFSPTMVESLFGDNAGGNPEWKDILPRVTCPILVITADPQLGSILTPADTRILQNFIPQLQIKHISKAGHSIRRDQLNQYMQVVFEFLAKQV